MENETENQNTPVEEEVLEVDMSDFNDDDDDDSSLEDTKQPTDEEVSTPAEPTEEEVDFTPLLNKLSKDIKYMDEEIVIDSLDDVKTNYQKGLDYDKKVKKLDELENSKMTTYLRNKAKESGMSEDDYIDTLEQMEVNQTKDQEQQEINEMIENGVAEHIAKKVIETNRVAKELKTEQLKLKEQQKLADVRATKDAENNTFLETYPDVNVKDIPKEVFKEAENSSLLTAYTRYQNKQLAKEIEILKQNKTNDKTSPVESTTKHGGVVVEKEDPFLTGFGIK